MGVSSSGAVILCLGGNGSRTPPPWVSMVHVVMDIMWPTSQSHFHVSRLCSLK